MPGPVVSLGSSASSPNPLHPWAAGVWGYSGLQPKSRLIVWGQGGQGVLGKRARQEVIVTFARGRMACALGTLGKRPTLVARHGPNKGGGTKHVINNGWDVRRGRGAVANVSPSVGAGIAVQLGCRMWVRLLSGLGHCACEPPRVMSRLRLWLPRLLLTWQQLWLLVHAVQPPEWALDPVQVTPNPARLTEAWSSHASDPPPKLPHALTPLAAAGGFNYLTSSSPVQMSAPPHQELTETDVPYLNTDSVGELPTGPVQFAVPHQDLNNKQTQHQKLPEEVPVLDWNQN